MAGELVSRVVAWGRRLMRRPLRGSYLPPARTTGAAPLVLIDGCDRPPDWLLIELRKLDQTAELVGLGDGRWWLGRVRPNRIRQKKAQVILALQESQTIRRETWIKHELARQGFGFIQEFTGEPNSRIILAFDYALEAERRDLFDREFKAMLRESDGTNHNARRRAILDDKRTSEGASEWRYVRGRRSVDMGRRRSRPA